jgi:hypothetical protein
MMAGLLIMENEYDDYDIRHQEPFLTRQQQRQEVREMNEQVGQGYNDRNCESKIPKSIQNNPNMQNCLNPNTYINGKYEIVNAPQVVYLPQLVNNQPGSAYDYTMLNQQIPFQTNPAQFQLNPNKVRPPPKPPMFQSEGQYQSLPKQYKLPQQNFQTLPQPQMLQGKFESQKVEYSQSSNLRPVQVQQPHIPHKEVKYNPSVEQMDNPKVNVKPSLLNLIMFKNPK